MSGGFSIHPAPSVRHDAGHLSASLREERAQNTSWLAAIWRRTLVAILLLEIALPIDKYLFFSKSDAEFGAISGFNLSLTTICLCLLYLQWLPRQIVCSARVRLSKSLLVYLAIVAGSFLWALNSNRTLFNAFLLFQAVLIFIYFVNNTKTRSDVMFAMVCLTGGLIIEAAVTLAVGAVGHPLSLGPIEFGVSEIDHRVTGPFGSPNVAASYVAILLAPCLSLFFVPASKFVRWLAAAAIFLGSAALILTMSRGGWLAAAFSLAIFVTVARSKGWLSGGKFAALMVCGFIFAAAFLPIVASRLLGDDAGSAAARMPLNEISGLMILDYPQGVGSNNWELAARNYAGQPKFRDAWFYTVHNHYLLVLCELGWLGFFSYMVFLGSILSCGWRALKRSDAGIGPILLGLTAAFAGQLIHMGFDIFNSRTQVQLICLVAALIFACADLSANTGEADDDADEVSATQDLSAGFVS